METKSSATKIEEVKRSMKFDNCFTVANTSYNGGLSLLWNQDLDLSTHTYSTWHINAMIKGFENQNQCITKFYGHLETSKRERSWSLLKLLNLGNNEAWFCLEEFNEITS